MFMQNEIIIMKELIYWLITDGMRFMVTKFKTELPKFYKEKKCLPSRKKACFA